MSNDAATPLVGILMGSASDWPTMQKCAETLRDFGIPYEAKALSAHRNPDQVAEYTKSAAGRGLKVLICAAGGAAHLAGVVAAHTALPVLACPMKAWSLEGLDSLLSMAQMPKGVPVATFAIGSAGAINAAIFSAGILALFDRDIDVKLQEFRRKQSETVVELPAE